MSYTYLQEQGEGSSVENFSDIEQFVRSRLKNTRGKLYSKGNETDYFHGSLSGMTSPLSTEPHGKNMSTLSQGDFLAKISQLLGGGEVCPVRDQDYGKSKKELLAKLDQVSCSWRIPQLSLFEEESELLQTLPRWGMCAGGELWETEPLVQYVKAREYGLSLLRPTAQCWKAWTFKNLKSLIRKNHSDGNIQEQSARCFHKMITAESNSILMKWPIKWASLRPWETDRIHSWQRSHSLFCQRD